MRKYAGYERIASIPTRVVVEALLKGEKHLLLNSIYSLHEPGVTQIHIESLRMQTYSKGISCVHCGRMGHYFAVERHRSSTSKFHLNLYHLSKDNKEVMITSDHIISKANGGSNKLENRQPMCSFCNNAKGAYDSVEQGRIAKQTIIERNQYSKLNKILLSMLYCRKKISEGDTTKNWTKILSAQHKEQIRLEEILAKKKTPE